MARRKSKPIGTVEHDASATTLLVQHRNRDCWHRAMVHDELRVVEDTHIHPWREAGADWPLLCGRRPHPNDPGAALPTICAVVGVWTHGHGAGSGLSSLYPSASCVGWSRISRRRHAFEPRLVWVWACSCMEDEPA